MIFRFKELCEGLIGNWCMSLWPGLLKGLYQHNFERTHKSITCVQIEIIYIGNFKNVIKNSKWYPFAMVTSQNPRKGAKNVFKPAKISQDREIKQS